MVLGAVEACRAPSEPPDGASLVVVTLPSHTVKFGALCVAAALCTSGSAQGQPVARGAQPQQGVPSSSSSATGPASRPPASQGPRTRCYGAGSQRYCTAYYPEGYCLFYAGRRSCHRYSTATGQRQPQAPYGAPSAIQPATQPTAQPTSQAAGPSPNGGAVAGETEQSGARTLKGYTFAYPRYFGNAFIATSFHAGAGVEFYGQEAVKSEVQTGSGETEVFEFDRDLVFARLRSNVDFAIGESFGFGAGAEYRAQVGANERSLFLYGAETGYAIVPRIKIRLVRSDRTGSQLTLQAHGAFSGGLRAVPQGLLRELALEIAEIAQDDERITCLVAADFECAFDEVDLASAIQLRRQQYGAGGMLSFAQRLGGVAGLQLATGLDGTGSNYSWAYLGEIDAGSFAFHVGGSPSLNFYPAFPLGLSFEYRFQVEHTSYSASEEAGLGADPSDTTTGHRLGVGVYFTGRRDLMLGAILGLSFVNESGEIGHSGAAGPDAFVAAMQFDMRYFF